MKTFKVTVCTAMLCAVTAVFAWDVEHDEIARLTGEALPAEIRAFFSFEDFGVFSKRQAAVAIGCTPRRERPWC